MHVAHWRAALSGLLGLMNHPGSHAFGVAARVWEGADARGQLPTGEFRCGGDDNHRHDDDQCSGLYESES